MKIYLSALIFLGLFFISADEKDTFVYADKSPQTKAMSHNSSENAADYLISRKKLDDSVKYTWFTKGYNNYKPDETKAKQLRKHRKHLRFVVFGGSWCEDTHMWLPKFYKVVEMAKIRKRDVTLYGVDRDKKPVGNVKDKTAPSMDYKVNRVPTFIVFYDDKEVGRVIESVRNSVEEDILKIVEKAAAESKK
ncbi:MAG: TlpA family protein disulfide reductase [Bacteroidia bacterium]